MADLYKHIFIEGNVKTEKFKQAPSRGGNALILERDRIAHSEKLLLEFEEIWRQKERLQQERTAEQISTRNGTYLSFTSAISCDLVTKSLEHISKGIRLLNIQEVTLDDNLKQIKATVYIPHGQEGHFINKITKYQNENVGVSEKPKNANLVNSIEDVSLALLESLWTDNKQLIPGDDLKWCEVWLNVKTNENLEQEQIAQFSATLENIAIEYKHDTIIFPERSVMLIRVNRSLLIELMLQSDLLAEFRIGQEPAGFWVNETSVEQENWVNDLLQRVNVISSDVMVCLLDSGVNNGHSLLKPLLDDDDTITVNSSWGTHDHHPEKGGHGTLMAGLAGYGNLEEALLSTTNVSLTHKLSSVKILPPPTSKMTPVELWGYITAQGIALAEIQNPEMTLVYCMAVTSKEDSEFGRPSSWSGELDNLSFGDGESQRLIIVSAGNIRDEELWKDYPDSNFISGIENPAQSWNVLTVGAFTRKVNVNEEIYKDYSTVALRGELSPFSTTSISWEKKWPIKPDVVFEGGNLLKTLNGKGVSRHLDLEMLSTSKSIRIKPFDTIYATSAATAQAAWFAAKIAFEYPEAWPETIRGLIVHSANWNSAMLNQMEVTTGSSKEYAKLLKVFGYGVPDLDRASYSKESAFTLIAQETIQPFGYNDKHLSETNEMHFFNLPWPKELLLSLGAMPVKLKITLSYFIEPGAGEIGWKDKYRYQSHGLLFALNNGEDETAFRKKINIAAREEDDEIIANSGSERWTLGSNNRVNGSIHSDIWEGTAAELATCNLIAVYPVIGWWRERKHLLRVETKTRYSLIVSLETPSEEVELYTTVKTIISIPIEIKTN